MKATLTLDDNVAQSAKEVAAKLKRPFKEVINLAVRIDLEHVEQPLIKKPYKTHSCHGDKRRIFLGQRTGIN